MANKQHLEWLREGVNAWNRRRATTPFRPDLISADLRGADLRGADLREADLGGADLTEADLRGADLEGADLVEAELSGAELREADLRGADLRGADLGGADLGGADLRGADLSDADLTGADLMRANLREADLRGANLRGAVLEGAELLAAKLQWADVRTTLFLVLDTNDVEAVRYTDLRLVHFIRQEQLDQMKGDSGTLIPAALTRPEHWPSLGDHPPPESSSNPAKTRKPSPVPFTPASEFETVEEQLTLKHLPERPEPRRASQTPPDTKQAEALRKGLENLAANFASGLREYAKIEDDTSNRVRAAAQLLKTTEGLLKALRMPEDDFLPTLMEDYVETLALAYNEDVHALEAADAGKYQRLIDRGRELYRYYPELPEIGDPQNTRFIPDDFPYTVATLSAEIDEVVYSAEGLLHFSDSTRDLIEGEKQAMVPKDVDPEKTKLARLSGIVGEMYREMKRNAEAGVKDAETWLKLYERVTRIWDKIGPIFEAIVSAGGG